MTVWFALCRSGTNSYRQLLLQACAEARNRCPAVWSPAVALKVSALMTLSATAAGRTPVAVAASTPAAVVTAGNEPSSEQTAVFADTASTATTPSPAFQDVDLDAVTHDDE